MKISLKRKLWMAMPLLCSLFLCGCINSVKLTDQAIVQSVAIDLEDDKIKLSMQIFAPSKSGEGKIGASADNAKLIEATGATITEAMQNATLMQGKKIFSGHNRIIIIGEELAKKDMNQLLEYFSSNTFARKNVNVVIARGKASDIVKTKLNQGMMPADILQLLVSNANETGFADNVLLYEFERSMQNNYDSDILPIIKKQETKQEKESQGGSGGGGGGGKKEDEQESKKDEIEAISTIELDGCAIISNGKMIDSLPKDETRGLLWLRDAIDSTTLITKTDVFSLACVNLSKIKTEIKPHVTKEKMLFEVTVRCKASMGELHVADGKVATTDDIKGIQQAAESLIEYECKAAFERAIIQDKADVFNFGALVWASNKEIWREIRDSWSENVHKLKINVTADVDIDSIGLKFNENREKR